MNDVFFQLDQITYSYIDGNRKRIILNNLSYDFVKGKFYTILGPSGSGKSTLLSVAAALDQPESGTARFSGKDIRDIGFTQFRRNDIAIIFQKYNLLNYLTALENVESDMMIVNRPMNGNSRMVAYKILDSLDIVKTKADRRVTALSGGEQQRVTIARALAKDVALILGDEPTGALDTATSREIINLYKILAHDYEKTIIIVTHSDEVASQSDRILYLCDGKLEAARSM